MVVVFLRSHSYHPPVTAFTHTFEHTYGCTKTPIEWNVHDIHAKYPVKLQKVARHTFALTYNNPLVHIVFKSKNEAYVVVWYRGISCVAKIHTKIVHLKKTIEKILRLNCD